MGYDSAAPSGLRIYKSGNGGYIPTTGSNAGVGNYVTPVYVDNGLIKAGQTPFTAFGATDIPANANLNTATYTAVGKYRCMADSTAQTLTNFPDNQAFVMEVTNPRDTNTGAIATTYQNRIRRITTIGGREYIQYVYTASSATVTYGDWQRVVHNTDLVHLKPTNATSSITNSSTDEYRVGRLSVFSG